MAVRDELPRIPEQDDPVEAGELARIRAQAAAERADELRARLTAFANGSDCLKGSSPDELGYARAQAENARIRLATALERSAAAHDRAANTIAVGQPNGHQRAEAHRAAAEADRQWAARVRAGD